MNPSSDGTVITESRVLPMRQKLKIATVVIVVPVILGLGWYGWQWYQNTQSTELASYGLDSELPLDNNPPGQLYFSAATIGNDIDSLVPNIYAYDFSTKNSNSVSEAPAHSYARGNEEFDAAIAYLASSSDPDGYQPAWINKTNGTVGALSGVNGYGEVGLTVSINGEYYAYAYRSTLDGDASDLDQWNIAIHNYKTQEVVTINKAAKPKFINEDSAVVYMTSQGISQYTLASKEEKLIFDTYSNLTMQDNFDLSKDASKMILTLQRLNLISVIEDIGENEKFQEIGVIREESARFTQPLISPDNRFYVVMSALNTNYSPDTQSYTKMNAEVRSWGNSNVLEEISFDGLYPESITLEAWVN